MAKLTAVTSRDSTQGHWESEPLLHKKTKNDQKEGKCVSWLAAAQHLFQPLHHRERKNLLKLPSLSSLTTGTVPSSQQCWNFRTICGGQEPSKNRAVVPARQPMQPGGPVRQPYSYSVQAPIDCSSTEPVFVNLVRSAGIDSQPVRNGTTTLFVIPARQANSLEESIPRNRFLGSLNVYKYGLRPNSLFPPVI